MDAATKRVEQLKKQFTITEDTYSVALPENVSTDHEFRVRRSIHSPHKLVEGLAPPFAHIRTLYDLLESSLTRFANVGLHTTLFILSFLFPSEKEKFSPSSRLLCRPWNDSLN